MALAAVNITIGSALSENTFNSSLASRSLPLADPTALTAAVDAALLAAAGDHDSTPEIEDIQTEVAALALGIPADVSIVLNTETITTRKQLQYALKVAMDRIAGSDLLTP